MCAHPPPAAHASKRICAPHFVWPSVNPPPRSVGFVALSLSFSLLFCAAVIMLLSITPPVATPVKTPATGAAASQPPRWSLPPQQQKKHYDHPLHIPPSGPPSPPPFSGPPQHLVSPHILFWPPFPQTSRVAPLRHCGPSHPHSDDPPPPPPQEAGGRPIGRRKRIPPCPSSQHEKKYTTHHAALVCARRLPLLFVFLTLLCGAAPPFSTPLLCAPLPPVHCVFVVLGGLSLCSYPSHPKNATTDTLFVWRWL